MVTVSDLKAACPHCGGRMAFPREAANQIVSCPHCQSDTVLSLTKLMLVTDRTTEAPDHPVPAPTSSLSAPAPDTDRPLSRRDQKALFASWRQARQAERERAKAKKRR